MGNTPIGISSKLDDLLSQFLAIITRPLIRKVKKNLKDHRSTRKSQYFYLHCDRICVVMPQY